MTCMILCENSMEPLTVSKAVLLQHSTSDIMADVLSIAWTELLGEKAIWEFYGWTCEHNSVTNWTAQRFLLSLHTPNIIDKFGFTGRLTTT